LEDDEMNFPHVTFLKSDGAQEQRAAYGREQQDGRAPRLLLFDSAAGKAGRYALYPYCETHSLAWESGDVCPLCHAEMEARLERI
jgi:hypothetical protein